MSSVKWIRLVQFLKDHKENLKFLFMNAFFVILDVIFKVKQCQMSFAYTLS